MSGVERRTGWAFRISVSALALASVGMEALYVRKGVLLFQAGEIPGVVVAGEIALAPSIAFAASFLALALLWRAQASRESRVLALFLALLAYWVGSQSIWLVPGFEDVSPFVDGAINVVHGWALLVCGAALLRFSALFPVELSPEGLLAVGAGIQPAGAVLGMRAALLRPRLVWGITLGMCLAVAAVMPLLLPSFPHYRAVGAVAVPVLIVLQLAILVSAAANLRSGYRVADEAGRRRVFWLLEGLLAGASILVIASAVKALQLLTYTRPGALNWYAGAIYLSILVILAGIAVAMFFSGALDPALAIRRTAVFGLVGITMVFIFAGVENAMQNLVAERLGMSDHLSGLISGGLVALTFDRIKERFNRLVERWSGRAGGPTAHDVPAPSEIAGVLVSPHRPIAPSAATDPEA